jgi:glycosyltransferase involved in cell wall biosynthesis
VGNFDNEGLTGLIIAGNEERNIGNCLKSLVGKCSRVKVSFNGTDNTGVIAGSLGAEVYREEWLGYRESRQKLLDRVEEGRWVIQIDADERLQLSRGGGWLGKELEKGKYGGYSIKLYSPVPRLDGKGKGVIESEVYRLYQKVDGMEYHPEYEVHETVLPWVQGKGIKSGYMSHLHIMHLGYDIELSAYKAKAIRNLSLLEGMVESGVDDGYVWYHIMQGRIASGNNEGVVDAAINCLAKGMGNPRLLNVAYGEGKYYAELGGYKAKYKRLIELGKKLRQPSEY